MKFFWPQYFIMHDLFSTVPLLTEAYSGLLAHIAGGVNTETSLIPPVMPVNPAAAWMKPVGLK